MAKRRRTEDLRFAQSFYPSVVFLLSMSVPPLTCAFHRSWRHSASYRFLTPQRRKSRPWTRLLSATVPARNLSQSHALSETVVLPQVVARVAQQQPTDLDGIRDLCQSWRKHPDLNPTVRFKSWTVPVVANNIQTILGSPRIQPYLARQCEVVNHLNVRLKTVRDYKCSVDGESGKIAYKLILLHPDTPSLRDLPCDVQSLLQDAQAADGPNVPISFVYKQFTASYILTTLLPAHLHPPPTSFETIGHVAHLNLKASHQPYSSLIGQVLLETLPYLETIICKQGEVTGPYRTYNFFVAAGRNDTNVQLTEAGVVLAFDVAKVYWSSRLAHERQRLLQVFQSGDIVADAFCGVGALCLLARLYKNCVIWANDWNPDAITALRNSALRNQVTLERVCNDEAYDFLIDIGLNPQRLPHHVVLNYPLEAMSFLGALRWWSLPPNQTGQNPRIYVYTFARADEATHRTAEQVAMDDLAQELLPLARLSIHRQVELDRDYGCRVDSHHVRDVAPGKLVLCVSFSVTTKLLRHMQGDF